MMMMMMMMMNAGSTRGGKSRGGDVDRDRAVAAVSRTVREAWGTALLADRSRHHRRHGLCII